MTLQNLRIGDHLKVSRGVYTHHMLYMGNGMVIHYSGWANGPFDNENAKVEIARLHDVCRGQALVRVDHAQRKFYGQAAVDRAKKRLHETQYDLLTNNCEHFVNWAILGEHKSEQVTRATTAVDVVLAGAVPLLVDAILTDPMRSGPIVRPAPFPRLRVREMVDRVAKAKEQELYMHFGAVAYPPKIAGRLNALLRRVA